jgi:hypothetical protein
MPNWLNRQKIINVDFHIRITTSKNNNQEKESIKNLKIQYSRLTLAEVKSKIFTSLGFDLRTG